MITYKSLCIPLSLLSTNISGCSNNGVKKYCAGLHFSKCLARSTSIWPSGGCESLHCVIQLGYVNAETISIVPTTLRKFWQFSKL